jgi:hypothetical protein
MNHNRRKLFSRRVKPLTTPVIIEDDEDILKSTAKLEELIGRKSLNPRRNLEISSISNKINTSLLSSSNPQQGIYPSLLDRGRVLQIEKNRRKQIHQIIHEEASAISGELYNLDLSKDSSQETEVSILVEAATIWENLDRGYISTPSVHKIATGSNIQGMASDTSKTPRPRDISDTIQIPEEPMYSPSREESPRPGTSRDPSQSDRSPRESLHLRGKRPQHKNPATAGRREDCE